MIDDYFDDAQQYEMAVIQESIDRAVVEYDKFVFGIIYSQSI